MAGERRRHPVAGWLIVLATLVVVGGGGLVLLFGMALSTLNYSGSPPPYASVYAAMGVLMAGGLWCAWRVGSGRWSLHRRPIPAGTGAKEVGR
jgi:hypothetical protein